MNLNRKLYRNLQKNQIDYNKKNKDNILTNNNYLSMINRDSIMNIGNDDRDSSFERKLEQLELQEMNIFKSDSLKRDDLYLVDNYLYHGIRFQKHLEKLESIFKSRAILAGNYQESYYNYEDNCNEGEYISLVGWNKEIIYETFILENISLVISPDCNAIETIYLPYDEWEQLKGRTTKNRYSYASGEYQVKYMIPLEMVKAIGLPASYLRLIKGQELVEIYKKDILKLMAMYDIDLPIVDTSYYNMVLVPSKKMLESYSLRRKK